MDPQVKADWLAALRSGSYQQGAGNLHVDRADEVPKFCCLGVLCDLAVEAGVISEPTYSDGSTATYGAQQEGEMLPKEVVEWAGIDDNEGVLRGPVPYGENGGMYHTLIHMNDSDVPFTKIAEVIEEQF